MKKIGIVGGLGPESTVEYYAKIISAFRESYEITGFPEIIVNSLDLKKFFVLASQNKWNEITLLISGVCEQLHNSGADFGAIASNTPHKVFNEIQAETKLKLISIVEATKQYVEIRKMKKLLLLGTKFTMSSDFYQNSFSGTGVELCLPTAIEQDYIQHKLFSEIELGIILPETKTGFLKIINRISVEQKTEGVILGCTELPLILKPGDIEQEYIDPAEIHIKAIVAECKSQ
jgi:aspartate racemase